MTEPIHKTELELHPSGEYPVALRDTKSILVEEQKNFVPMYMPGMVMNSLEAKVENAEEHGKAEGEIAQEQAAQVIEAFKGSIKNMLRGMREYGSEEYINGVLLSNDLDSLNPAITKPKNPRFSFEFKPKNFTLGLTGRLLEDDNGQRFQELLTLNCTIYDAYDLATSLNPKRIVALDAKDREEVIYEDYKIIGKNEKFDSKGKSYVLHPENKWLTEQEVLPTEGLKLVYSDFWNQIKDKYDRSAMLFGHKYNDMREFLSMVTLTDNHLFWDICANNNDPNKPLIDCEKEYGLKNKVAEFPYHKNRLQLIPHNACFCSDKIHIYFDDPSAYQALMSLGDVVRDIWMDPRDRSMNEGWDIVFDRSRGITPEKPVAVITTEDTRGYPVLK